MTSFRISLFTLPGQVNSRHYNVEASEVEGYIGKHGNKVRGGISEHIHIQDI